MLLSLSVQVLQQELENMSKERPSLTPRPTREVMPLKDLIKNDKASALDNPLVLVPWKRHPSRRSVHACPLQFSLYMSQQETMLSPVQLQLELAQPDAFKEAFRGLIFAGGSISMGLQQQQCSHDALHACSVTHMIMHHTHCPLCCCS